LTAEDSRQNVRFEKVSAIKDVRVTRAVLENHKIAHPELYKGDERKGLLLHADYYES